MLGEELHTAFSRFRKSTPNKDRYRSNRNTGPSKLEKPRNNLIFAHAAFSKLDLVVIGSVHADCVKARGQSAYSSEVSFLNVDGVQGSGDRYQTSFIARTSRKVADTVADDQVRVTLASSFFTLHSSHNVKKLGVTLCGCDLIKNIVEVIRKSFKDTAANVGRVEIGRRSDGALQETPGELSKVGEEIAPESDLSRVTASVGAEKVNAVDIVGNQQSEFLYESAL